MTAKIIYSASLSNRHIAHMLKLFTTNHMGTHHGHFRSLQYSTLGEFENGGFTLKTHQMFFIHAILKEIRNATITASFYICICVRIGQGNVMIIVSNRHRYRKQFVFKMFSVPTRTQNRPFSNSSGLMSVFEKLRFRDGLVWTGGPNRRNKAAFHVPPS